MSLVATVTTTPPADRPIQNNGFWADVDPAHCRHTTRMPEAVSADRLAEALGNAIDHANRLLSSVQAAHVAEGRATAAAIPLRPWQRPGWHAARYRRAVYALALAELSERYREITATAGAPGQTDTIQAVVDSAGDYRRDAHGAIRDLYHDAPAAALYAAEAAAAAEPDGTGSRTVVELI